MARPSKNSRVEPEVKNAKNAESANERHLPSTQRDAVSSSAVRVNNTSIAPAAGERQGRRSKVKERDSAPVSTRASRRNRVHAARSTDTVPISPVSGVSTSTSATIRLSPMNTVVMASAGTTPTSSPRKGRKEDGWKEVGRR